MTVKRIGASDLDGTHYRWSQFIDLVDRMIEDGSLSSEVKREAQDQERAWRERRGTYNAYMRALVDAFFRHIRGVDARRMRRAAEHVLQEKGQRVYIFTRELLLTLQELGYVTVAITGSFQQIAEIFGAAWGFAHVMGTVPELDEHGCFTGIDDNSVKPMADKGKAFQEAVAQFGCTVEGSIGLGDTRSDLSLLASVQFPLAINPDAELAAAAHDNDYGVVLERKDVIYLMRQDLIVTPREILPFDVVDRFRERLDSAGVHVYGVRN